MVKYYIIIVETNINITMILNPKRKENAYIYISQPSENATDIINDVQLFSRK